MNPSAKSVVSLLLVSSTALASVFTSGCYVRANLHGAAAREQAPSARHAPPSIPPSAPGANQAPEAPTIRYDHFVDGRFNGHVDFQPIRAGAQRGTMRNDSNTMSGTWVVEGNHLTMTWPNASAPGGAYVDDVVFSPDRAVYEGRNNLGSAISGQRSSDPIVRPTEVPQTYGQDTMMRYPTPGVPIERRADGTCWQSPIVLPTGAPTRPMLMPAVQVFCR